MSKKLKTGKTNLPPDEFEPKNVKVRISMMLPGDVLDEFKSIAAKSGRPYQIIMQEKLREAAFGKVVDPALRDTIREVVREELNKAS